MTKRDLKIMKVIEDDLIEVMNRIDETVSDINNLDNRDPYEQQIMKLVQMKREVKQILNKDFDQLAVKRKIT